MGYKTRQIYVPAPPDNAPAIPLQLLTSTPVVAPHQPKPTMVTIERHFKRADGVKDFGEVMGRCLGCNKDVIASKLLMQNLKKLKNEIRTYTLAAAAILGDPDHFCYRAREINFDILNKHANVLEELPVMLKCGHVWDWRCLRKFLKDPKHRIFQTQKFLHARNAELAASASKEAPIPTMVNGTTQAWIDVIYLDQEAEQYYSSIPSMGGATYAAVADESEGFYDNAADENGGYLDVDGRSATSTDGPSPSKTAAAKSVSMQRGATGIRVNPAFSKTVETRFGESSVVIDLTDPLLKQAWDRYFPQSKTTQKIHKDFGQKGDASEQHVQAAKHAAVNLEVTARTQHGLAAPNPGYVPVPGALYDNAAELNGNGSSSSGVTGSQSSNSSPDGSPGSSPLRTQTIRDLTIAPPDSTNTDDDLGGYGFPEGRLPTTPSLPQRNSALASVAAGGPAAPPRYMRQNSSVPQQIIYASNGQVVGAKTANNAHAKSKVDYLEPLAGLYGATKQVTGSDETYAEPLPGLYGATKTTPAETARIKDAQAKAAHEKAIAQAARARRVALENEAKNIGNPGAPYLLDPDSLSFVLIKELPHFKILFNEAMEKMLITIEKLEARPWYRRPAVIVPLVTVGTVALVTAGTVAALAALNIWGAKNNNSTPSVGGDTGHSTTPSTTSLTFSAISTLVTYASTAASSFFSSTTPSTTSHSMAETTKDINETSTSAAKSITTALNTSASTQNFTTTLKTATTAAVSSVSTDTMTTAASTNLATTISTTTQQTLATTSTTSPEFTTTLTENISTALTTTTSTYQITTTNGNTGQTSTSTSATAPITIVTTNTTTTTPVTTATTSTTTTPTTPTTTSTTPTTTTKTTTTTTSTTTTPTTTTTTTTSTTTTLATTSTTTTTTTTTTVTCPYAVCSEACLGNPTGKSCLICHIPDCCYLSAAYCS